MILEGFAKYCALRGASFADYCKGVDLLMERDGYWINQGYAAVLSALNQHTVKPEPYTVKV